MYLLLAKVKMIHRRCMPNGRGVTCHVGGPPLHVRRPALLKSVEMCGPTPPPTHEEEPDEMKI